MSDPVLARFAACAKVLAPEADVYLINQPEAWPTPNEADAYALPRVTAVMRDYLVGRGEWRGYLPAIVFITPVDDSEDCRGNYLHELAHILPQPEATPDVPVTDVERRFEDVIFGQLAETPRVSGAPPWDGHGVRFIRKTLHLSWRAAVKLGWSDVRLYHLRVAGPQYGLSPLWMYDQALGAEPERMAGATFEAIEATPIPQAMKDLWQADVTAHFQRHHSEMELVA